MASMRLHPTDSKKLIVDAHIDGRRQQLVFKDIEEAMLTIALDPSFSRLAEPIFTIDQLVDRYLRRCEADNLRSLRSLRKSFKMVTRELGQKQAASLTSRDLMDWAANLTKTYAHNSVATAVQILGSLYREAVQEELLWSNPVRDMHQNYRHRPTAQASYPTAGEEDRLIAQANDLRARTVMRCLLDAGLQSNELSPLNNEDFDGSVLRISSVINDRHEIVPAMEHRCRSVPLSKELISDLLAYKKLTGNAPKEPLLATIDGQRVKCPKTFSKLIGRVQVAAGMGRLVSTGSGRNKKKVPHGNFTMEELSARAAVKWLRSDVNIVLVMRRTGYSSYEKFSRRYSAVIGALPEGKYISAVDDLIWGADTGVSGGELGELDQNG